ncbi:galectin 17 [Genypterus blacodes]|uniref:galectin 17 n=1 Tax=Genypterus blacodes TaxID=154954 RepID=UPI003F7673E0
METDGTASIWRFLLLLLGLPLGSSADSLTPPVSLALTVGEQAVLPCSWTSRVNQATPPTCHVQWDNRMATVYEQSGEQSWQAAEFEGRANVSGERLRSGDCSLTIRDVQIIDTGMYRSFMVLDGQKNKRRVFIQTVKLSIFDHKTTQTGGPGEDLVLELYTPHSVRLIFQSRNSSEWSHVWLRGDQNSQRLEKHPHREELKLKGLKRSDQGFYKVLDEHGLAVSTVHLFVEDGPSAELQRHLLPGDAPPTSSCSLLLQVIAPLLVVLHLL